METDCGKAFVRWTQGCNDRDCWADTYEDCKKCETCEVYLKYKKECENIISLQKTIKK